MFPTISKSYILVSFMFLLILSGVIYTYLEYTTIAFSLCEPCHENPKSVVDEVEKRAETNHCLYDDSKGVGNLIMQAGLQYPQPSTQQGRTDVNSVTNWNAPLVWEGTFDPVVIDDIYRRINPRVAVVVLAVGKYTRFLKGFLESGEKYFLVGFRVTYYIFTDQEQDVPNVTLKEGRKITVLSVPSAKRWQDVVLSKMKWATISIDKQIRNEADYLFMMDIDSVFHNRFGAESLSRMSAVLHRGYYKNTQRDQFPYERRPQSKAYIPAGEGDYYYTAAVWGGYLEDMYKLVKYCYEQSEEDAKNNIEAVWQEESHLNKYFLYNKPTKVLSPEYLWSDYDTPGSDIKLIRISQLVKNYAEVRPNGGQ